MDLNHELVDALNIEDFSTKKEYGRERGLVVSPSEAQARVIDKLWQKINAKMSSKAKKDDDEESLIFDLKSKPRILLFEAPLLKRCK
jgi:SAM-dependent MidA family methyltransferase